MEKKDILIPKYDSEKHLVLATDKKSDGTVTAGAKIGDNSIISIGKKSKEISLDVTNDSKSFLHTLVDANDKDTAGTVRAYANIYDGALTGNLITNSHAKSLDLSVKHYNDSILSLSAFNNPAPGESSYITTDILSGLLQNKTALNKEDKLFTTEFKHNDTKLLSLSFQDKRATENKVISAVDLLSGKLSGELSITKYPESEIPRADLSLLHSGTEFLSTQVYPDNEDNNKIHIKSQFQHHNSRFNTSLGIKYAGSNPGIDFTIGNKVYPEMGKVILGESVSGIDIKLYEDSIFTASREHVILGRDNYTTGFIPSTAESVIIGHKIYQADDMTNIDLHDRGHELIIGCNIDNIGQWEIDSQGEPVEPYSGILLGSLIKYIKSNSTNTPKIINPILMGGGIKIKELIKNIPLTNKPIIQPIVIGNNHSIEGSLGKVIDIGHSNTIYSESMTPMRDSTTICLGNNIKSLHNSICIGYSAGISDLDNKNANNIIAIGNVAKSNASGGIAIGYSSGIYSRSYGQSSVGSIAIGEGASVLAGDWAIALGSYASSEGQEAIAIGKNTQSKNCGTAIGGNAYSEDYGTAIGHDAYSNGYGVAIGVGAVATSGEPVKIRWRESAGNFRVASIVEGTAYWSIESDERIKENIELADTSRCLSGVLNVPVKRFNFKEDLTIYADKHQTGFIAQDLEKEFPKLVHTVSRTFKVGDKETKFDDLKVIEREPLIPVLWGAVQELAKQLEVAKKEIKSLKSKVSKLSIN